MDSSPRPDVLPPQTLQLSADEQNTRRLSPETRRLASILLSCRGYVIFKDAFRKEEIERLAKEINDIYQDCRTTPDLHETGEKAEDIQQMHVSARKRAAFWFRRSRWRIFPRLVPPVSDVQVLANSYVVPVLEDLLGDDFYCKYVSSDTCLAGSILQSPHSDIDGNEVMVNNRWVPRGYIVNIPVMYSGLHNGPIEVWPGGSHMWTQDLMQKYGLSPDVQDGRNPKVEEVARYLPSVKLTLSPGEIMIRDLAMWHRGTPNPTDEVRTMLTMGFFRSSLDYGYGDPSYNLDREEWEGLHPRIQKMFAYHFNLKNTLKREQRALRKKAKSVVKDWVKARLPR